MWACAFPWPWQLHAAGWRGLRCRPPPMTGMVFQPVRRRLGRRAIVAIGAYGLACQDLSLLCWQPAWPSRRETQLLGVSRRPPTPAGAPWKAPPLRFCGAAGARSGQECPGALAERGLVWSRGEGVPRRTSACALACRVGPLWLIDGPPPYDFPPSTMLPGDSAGSRARSHASHRGSPCSGSAAAVDRCSRRLQAAG